MIIFSSVSCISLLVSEELKKVMGIYLNIKKKK